MSERTSNKQILDAILALTEAITATKVAPIADPIDTPPEEDDNVVKIDGAYKAHMALKVQQFATDKGEATVMYARRNGRGETKLAYCLHSKWTNLKDKGLIGAVQTFNPVEA